MNTSLITVLAAVGGSIIGAAASVITTWITERTKSVREHTESQFREREALYGEFINEASRLAVDALSHPLESLEKLVNLYGIIGRIRLVSSDEVLAEAEKCCREIINLYARPNMTADRFSASFNPDELDPLKPFSSACREELRRIAGTF
jgi:hypothetical protein